MATFKHISSKNADYGAAEQYLTFEHDEFTMKPTLDENGRLIPREDYRISSLNCGGEDFAVACMRANLRYEKNQKREDVKSHHYIISFDPRDGTDNGLTVDRAQALGEEFCAEHFPGHQAIVCTHPDGHNHSGNIHVHIVINSLRIYEVPLQSVDQMKAIKLVKSKVTDINRMKIEEQKKAVRAGYDMDIIPSDLNTYGGEAKRLLEDLQSRNERMFLVTALFLNTAKSKQELENTIFQTAGIAQKYNCMLKRLDYQQEEGLMSSLPLGVSHIPIKRALTTTSTAIFVPFTTQELFMGGDSLYYGLNATSNNLIMVDRKKSKNPNGLILGTPGSGKSFAAKREMTNVFFTTNDDIIIGDPEGEYYPLVHALGGQVIHISPNSKDYINPMDINMNYSEDDNPLGVKSDFILSLCELIMGSRDGIEAEEKSVIDRCLPLVYQNYFSDPKPENMPILGDLYDCLRKQKEPQAQRIATALEIYVNGSLKVFNHQTNVELNNRIVCFDIKELGKQLKKLGMLIIQDQVWNRVTVNRGVKSTWYYIDEFHLLLKEEQTASYSVEIFKRFRKWQGIPTGITQNIKDLLASREIENILDNSDFILMLNQAAGDRQILAKQLNISPYQLSYVTNSGEGEGLLFYGTTIIPFKDKFDKSLKLYSLMTTKPEEVEQREKEGGGSLGRERTERKRESCK